MTQVLTALGSRWEGQVAIVLEASAHVRISRRCADVPDLLATAAAGLGEVVLVTSDLRGLDLTVVSDLRGLGLRIVGLTVDGSEAEDRWLRSLGITVLAPVRSELADLEAALLVRTPDGGGPQSAAAADDRAPGGAPQGAPDALAALTSELSPPATAQGMVIAVWGPIGAPGRTTVAVNLAAEVAAAGRRTLLVDLDTYGGTVAQVLSLLDEAPGIAAACRAAEHGALDVVALARLSPEVVPRLRVLTGIPKPERWTELRAAAVERVLALGATLADVVVVDCGFCLEDDEELSYDTLAPRRNATTRSALAHADVLLAVGAAEPVGLQRLVRGLQQLTDIESPSPFVVVTKVRSGAVGPRPEEAIAETLARFAGIDQLAFVPDDRDVLDAAMLAGRTLVEHAPASAARGAIAELAHQVVGIPAPVRRRSRRGTMST
jgi:Flp pilus assembly CpaE family ATPase